MASSTSDDKTRTGSYQVLARRFRPARFEDVVGQEQVVTTLKGCLSEGRLPHAFLFCGSRGVGKTTSARILARAVNCETGDGPEPCGECAACQTILAGTASDVVELDAASHNGVDEVRALREQAGYAPLHLRKKVFVLDEVHMFSRSAFNALLKILEEPPEHVIFVLATTELHKVPDTVQSRCQVLSFRRIQEKDIRARLQQIAEREGVQVDPEILAEIAASSLGGLRDAETALERVLPLAQGLDLEGYRQLEGRLGFARTAELVQSCLAGDTQAALRYAFEAAQSGVDERECLGEVLELLRQLFVLRIDGPESMLLEAGGETRKRLVQLAEGLELAQLDARMQILVLARDRIRQIDDRRVYFELTLVRLAQIAELMSLGEIAAGEGPGGGPAGAPATASRAAAPTSAPSAAAPRAPAPSAPAPSAPAPSAPAPSAPAPSAPAPADAWQRVVETALAEKKVIGTVLGRAALTWPAKDHALLSFTKPGSFDRRLLEKSTTQDYLTELFTRILARTIRVEIQLGDGPAGTPAPPTQASPPRDSKPSTRSRSSGAPSDPQLPGSSTPGSARENPRKAPPSPSSSRAAPAPTRTPPPVPQDPGAGQEQVSEEELPPIGKDLKDLFGARVLGKQQPEDADGGGSSKVS
jgi:DNA polymerase-3 subunit gamma/tau